MPRKLPWTGDGGGRARAQGKPTAAKKVPIHSEPEDDFFAGTVLESSRKGKQRTESPPSNDELPDIPLVDRTPSRKSIGKQRAERVPSSSPPPAVSDLPPPTIEHMREGVNRFNLRDDEWMMVEDEFHQTAKLLTQHLHLAEYERLKEQIQTKKEVARPVVPSAKPSEERKFQMRAEQQAKAQKKALKDIQADKYLSKPSSSRTGLAQGLTKPSASGKTPLPDTSDSEDLDAPARSTQPSRAASSRPFTKPSLPPTSLSSVTRPARASGSKPPARKFTQRSTSPAKRGVSSSLRDSSPSKHATKASFRSSSPAKTLTQTEKPIQTARIRSSARPTRSFDIFDDEDDFLRPTPLPKEHAERLAKRKADKEKEEEAKKKTIGLNEIPTFLF